MRQMSVRVTVILIVLFLWKGLAHPQRFGVNGATSSMTTIIKSEHVRQKALNAFRETTADRLNEARQSEHVDAEKQKRMGQVVSQMREKFSKELERGLQDLEGDGVLEVDEVTEEIRHLREALLGDLTVMLEAIQKGYPPPPFTKAFDSNWDYAKNIAIYTFVTRNSPTDWGRFAMYVTAGFLFAWLANKIIDGLSRVLREKGWRSTALLLQSSDAPLYLIAVITGFYFGFEYLWIPGIAEPVLGKIIDIALIVALFWFLWGGARAAASGIAWFVGKTYNTEIDHHIELVILRIIHIILLVLFVVTLVKVVLSTGFTGVITGLGVIGVALSFVLRGSIENIAAAFILFGDKPIRVGDTMIYKDHWGTVEDIGFRAVRFRTFEGHLFSIPNSEIIDESIQNVGSRPYIRRRFRIGLTYDTPPEKVCEAMEILRDILDDHDGQPEDQPPHVEFEAYGEYDLRLLVQYYYQPPNYWGAMAFDSKVNLEILKRFNEAGLEFAFPTETTVVKTDPENVPELSWRKGTGFPSEKKAEGEAVVNENSDKGGKGTKYTRKGASFQSCDDGGDDKENDSN